MSKGRINQFSCRFPSKINFIFLNFIFRQLRMTFFHKIMVTEKNIFQIPPSPGEVKIYFPLPFKRKKGGGGGSEIWDGCKDVVCPLVNVVLMLIYKYNWNLRISRISWKNISHLKKKFIQKCQSENNWNLSEILFKILSFSFLS